MRRRWLKSSTMLILALLLLAGCPPPARRPEPNSPKLGVEPTITLKDHRAGQQRQMKLEEYLLGVVAGEIPNDWPVEALAAQAIVARTFTVKKIGEGKQPSTDEKEFQAYNPVNINPAIRRAVEMTRGLIITHQGRAVNAFFHSCSGGSTATPAEGLGFTQEPTPYLRAVKDQPCADPEKQAWRETFSRAEIVQAAAGQGQEISGEFSSARITQYGPSGRALRIAFGGSEVNAVPLRTALDPIRMRSTLLTEIKVEGDQVVMAGKGFGHGVGLPQFGALEMGKQGKLPEEIIKRYYSGVEVVQHYR